MNYQNSRLEVVSFSRLLDKYVAANSFDAILLNSFDDYQGIVSADDVRRYDLQLAVKIELAQGADRPTWLQPFLKLPALIQSPQDPGAEYPAPTHDTYSKKAPRSSAARGSVFVWGAGSGLN